MVSTLNTVISVSDSLTTTTSVVLTVSMIAAGGGALFMGTSLNSFWALANQLQLIILYPFLRVKLGEPLTYFINDFQFTAFDFSFLSFFQIPYFGEALRDLDYPQNDEVFAENGYDSGSYLVNYYGLIKSLTIALTINAIYGILFYIIWYTGWAKAVRYMKKGFEFFHLAVYIRIFIEAYIFNLIVSANEVEQYENIVTHTTSYIISVFILLGSISFLIFILAYYKIKWRK